jgi:hypothetical protein
MGMYTEHYFEGIATDDEFWFQSSSYSDCMFADSRESAVPRIRQDISEQKTSGVGGPAKRYKDQS